MTAANESARDPAAAPPGRAFSPRWFHVVLALGLVVAIVLPLCRRSINLSDEGYILLQSLDMLRGKVLYRDMDAFVTPGIWFLLSTLFRFVEPSVLASRALSLGAYVAMLGVACHIVATLTSRAYALACSAVLLVFVVWAFPIWTWTFYSPFAVLFCLVGLDRLLRWRATRSQRDLFWVGLCFGLAILFKQNYGAFGLAGALLSVVRVRRETSASPDTSLVANLAAVALGGLVVGLPVIAYFAAHDALPDAFRSLVVHPFVFAGQHSVPYLGPAALFDADVLAGADRFTYGANSLYSIGVPGKALLSAGIVERMHVLLYQFPPLIFLAGAWLAIRPRRRGPDRRRESDGGLFCLVAVGGVMFLGVFPRADYNHLVNVYQPVIVTGVVVVQRLAQAFPPPRNGWLRLAQGLGASLLLAYASLGIYWYQQILVGMNTRITPRRGGVLERPEYGQRLNQLVEIVWANTREGESLLSVPDLAMLNFLAAREMPSPYYNLYQHHIAHDGGAAVVKGSQQHAVNLAVTRYNGFFSDRERLRDYAPALIEHLDNAFRIQFTAAGDDFVFLHRRRQPAAARDVLRLLESCTLSPSDADHQIRHHLLFSTLYQDEGPHHEQSDWLQESRCEVQLPASPQQLSVRPGVYPPRDAELGATLELEVRVEREGFPATRVLRHREAVTIPPALQPIRTWPRELRADLSRFAGERVTLVFRSHRTGWVERNPHAFKGYATMWIDPKLLALRPR